MMFNPMGESPNENNPLLSFVFLRTSATRIACLPHFVDELKY
jgi:hypothetical protein